MATLTDATANCPDIGSFGNYDAYERARKEFFDSIDDPVIRFQVANGYAYYRVVEMEHVPNCGTCGRGPEPLLQYIQDGGPMVRRATIRGLNTQDVHEKIERGEVW